MNAYSASNRPRTFARPRQSSGFTLIELMVAMAVFLVICGITLSLFRQHATLFSDQQSQVGLNITLRNALEQMQTDTLNAGDGYFNAVNTTSWPTGITITNQAGPFDVLNVITAGSVPSQLDPAGCTNTNTSLTVNLAPAAGLTAAATAAQYSQNDEILFINGAGNQMTVATLTAPGAIVGGKIQLSHTATNPDGSNNPGPPTNDPLGLTTNFDTTDPLYSLGTQYCPANGDWVVKLTPITYSVNGLNQLTRTVPGAAPDVIADQVIGFKVGASTFTSAGVGSSTASYSFNAANKPTDTPPGYSSKFNSIRSIRVSLIGRTPPNQFTGTGFRNSFDGGTYKIQAISLVINPRNLSMND